MSARTQVTHVCWFHDNKTPNVADILDKEAGFVVHRLAFNGPEADNWAVLQKSHAYCMISTRDEIPEQYRGTRAFLQRCPVLLVISTSGAGYDPVDVAACTEAGVLVVNQAGANAEAVAEHTVAMMLALSKNIMQTDRALRQKQGLVREAFKGTNAQGRTVGIIGLSHVGQRVARICGKGLEMRVLAYDPYIPAAAFQAHGALQVSLDEILQQADYVTVHCPLTTETRGLIAQRQLALMRPSAFLINTARGGIVDEVALAQALTSGQIAGAGIDVWVIEPPPPDHPLLQLDNVIATCHTAGVTVDSRHHMAQWNAAQLVQIFHGARPPRLINPAAWDRFAARFAQAFGFQPQE